MVKAFNTKFFIENEWSACKADWELAKVSCGNAAAAKRPESLFIWKMPLSKAIRTAVEFSLSVTSYGFENAASSHVKANFYGLYHSRWQKKTVISSYKALMYSLMLY